MKKSIKYIYDFSGGYSTNLHPEQMAPNMLQTAENVYFQNGLEKRGGVSDYSTDANFDTDYDIAGQHRVKMNSTWYSIIAVDTGSEVKFYHAATTALTEIDAAYTFTTGHDVEMDSMYESVSEDNAVVVVNGTDKPAIIYYDSGIKIENLEAYDERLRDTDDWWAGQYDDSETTYTDDTTDAQDAGADDFQISTGTNDDGFYVSCQYTFNKIIMTNAQQFTSDPTVVYEYYKDNDDGTYTWTTVGTLVTTPDWDGVEGDKTIEFNIPYDWGKWDGTEETLDGRYVFRVRFTANAEDLDCDTLAVYHTQYLTQIMGGAKPSHVHVHRNKMYLSEGNNVNISPYNKLTDWSAYEVEVCQDGGTQINGMVSLNEDLLLFKENAIFRIQGNSYQYRTVKKISDNGAKYSRGIVQVNNVIFYLHTDGLIHAFTGANDKLVSRHIKDDLDVYTKSVVYAIKYKGYVWFSFPSDSEVLVFDPDSFVVSETDTGEGRMAFYKYTGITAKTLNWHSGDSDNGFLIGGYQATSEKAKLLKLDNGNAYDGSATTIDEVVKTKEYSFGSPQLEKIFDRTKPEITKSGDWTFTVYVDNEARNTSMTLSSGSGGTRYKEDVSLDYDMNGKDISFYFRNNTVNAAKIFGVAVEVGKRRF